MNRTTMRWTHKKTQMVMAAAGVLLAAGCNSFDPAPRTVTRTWVPDVAPLHSTSTETETTPRRAPEMANVTWGSGASTTPRRAELPSVGEVVPGNTVASTTPWSPNSSRVSFSEEGADFDPCVSRDGSRLVFASTQHRTTADLYIKQVNSKTVTQLTSGGSDNVMPDISPDGERIAFATNRNGSWDIFVMPVTGGQAVQLTSDAADELHPSWSPDGKEIVYCKLGETSGRWEMWVAPVQNPATPTFIGYGLFPRWCPMAGTGADGSDKILFQLSRERGNRTFGLWTVDYGHGMAGNPTEIASEPTRAFINPTWSPDGQWICYAEIPSVGSESANTARSGATTSRLPAVASLWMIGANGLGKVSLVGGNSASLMPTWSSDGSIYFVSNRGGSENIWSLNSAGAIKAARGATPNPTQLPVANVNEEHHEEGH